MRQILLKHGGIIREVTSVVACCSHKENLQQALIFFKIICRYYLYWTIWGQQIERNHPLLREDEDIAKSAYVHALVTTVGFSSASTYVYQNFGLSLKIKSQTVTPFLSHTEDVQQTSITAHDSWLLNTTYSRRVKWIPIFLTRLY